MLTFNYFVPASALKKQMKDKIVKIRSEDWIRVSPIPEVLIFFILLSNCPRSHLEENSHLSILCMEVKEL